MQKRKCIAISSFRHQRFGMTALRAGRSRVLRKHVTLVEQDDSIVGAHLEYNIAQNHSSLVSEWWLVIPRRTNHCLLFTIYRMRVVILFLYSPLIYHPKLPPLFTIHQVQLFELDQPAIPRSLLKIDNQNHELVRWGAAYEINQEAGESTPVFRDNSEDNTRHE
jgi:hypothetical protein